MGFIRKLVFFFMSIYCVFSVHIFAAFNEQYQDIIINNVLVSSGVRDCASRYEALKPILKKYKRPITVLDIGASQGYFSFRIAHDYNASCVMIEGDYNDQWHISDQLLDLCNQNSSFLKNIIFLKKRMSVQDLEQLAACEHFDVVLAFNVAHHFRDQWKGTVEAILSLGDNVIFENPPSNDVVANQNGYAGAIENFLLARGGKVILEVQRHTDPKAKGKMIWFSQGKTELASPYWFIRPQDCYKTLYKIKSTYTEKMFFKNKTQKWYPWHFGINLATFIMLNAVYPSREFIYAKVQELICNSVQLDDFMPWNIIVQGDGVALIDQDDHYCLDRNESIKFVCDMIMQKKPQEALRVYDAYVLKRDKKQK